MRKIYLKPKMALSPMTLTQGILQTSNGESTGGGGVKMRGEDDGVLW